MGIHQNHLTKAVLMSTTIYVLKRNMKNIRVFFIRNFSVFGSEIFYMFEKVCFRNVTDKDMHKVFSN